MLSILPAAGGDTDELKKKIKALEEENKSLKAKVDRLEDRLEAIEKKVGAGIQERRNEDRGRRDDSRDRAPDTYLFVFKDGSSLAVLSYEIKSEREFGMFGKDKKYYYVTLENGEVKKTEVDNVKEIRRADGR
jgi:regulator of replication initiation timing